MYDIVNPIMAYMIYIWYVVNPMMSLGISDDPRKGVPYEGGDRWGIHPPFSVTTHAIGIHLIENHGRNGDFKGEHGIFGHKNHVTLSPWVTTVIVSLLSPQTVSCGEKPMS